MYGRCIYCGKILKLSAAGFWQTRNNDNFCEQNDLDNFHETIVQMKLYTNDA